MNHGNWDHSVFWSLPIALLLLAFAWRMHPNQIGPAHLLDRHLLGHYLLDHHGGNLQPLLCPIQSTDSKFLGVHCWRSTDAHSSFRPHSGPSFCLQGQKFHSSLDNDRGGIVFILYCFVFPSFFLYGKPDWMRDGRGQDMHVIRCRRKQYLFDEKIIIPLIAAGALVYSARLYYSQIFNGLWFDIGFDRWGMVGS